MEAKYYRFIYRSLANGVCCTGSMAGDGKEEDEAFHFLYLGGGSDDCPDGEETDESLNGHFHLVIAANFLPVTVRQMVQVLARCQAEQVLFPKLEAAERNSLAEKYEKQGDLTKEEIGFVKDPETFLAGKGIEQCEGIGGREAFRKGNQRFRIFCVGEGGQRSLLLYHGSEGTSPQTEECVMNVKPVTPSRSCSPFVDPKNLNCEMRCMLYNDFTQCKRHNQKNGTYFVDGHLILSTGGAEMNLGEIKEALEAEWKKIRFVCLPDENSCHGYMEELKKAGTADMAQYFMGTEKTEDAVIKEILTNHPYRTFITLDEKAGLCVSGYYVGR